MSLLKKQETEVVAETSLRYKPQQPQHWKRWYWLEHSTRNRFLARLRTFCFLVYPAWVLTHLEYYKPDEERIRRAFLETELRSLHSPYARMKAMQERVGA
uniref:Uncharacterized protein n=1 Tax=Meloidogyne enterolobii TaxID=390850 RepID=A0A6V7VUF3_MELEN|nr:unnamed protein product [Meloidogyne enterolobii]